MATLDLFVVNVALHDIGHDLGSSQLSDLPWILNAYRNSLIYRDLLMPPMGLEPTTLGKKIDKPRHLRRSRVT